MNNDVYPFAMYWYTVHLHAWALVGVSLAGDITGFPIQCIHKDQGNISIKR